VVRGGRGRDGNFSSRNILKEEILPDIQFSFNTKSQILSFSEKIKCFSRKNSILDQISEIFFEKEKYSIALLTAHIIKNLIFPDKSKKAFLSIIQIFNIENNKDLKFEEFEKIHWIRIVQNEVVLPAVISYKIWLINNDDGKKEIDKIPEDRRDMALCLAAYAKTHDEPSITKEKISHILALLNLNWESISFLLEKHILEYDINKDIYHWHGKIQYLEQFENEVSALLWILIKNQSQNSEEAFKEYLFMANKTELSFRKLYSFLSKDDTKLLYEQAINYIQNDQDLLVCDDELEKMRLDTPFSHIDINQKAPDFNFRCNTIRELFEKLKQLENLRGYEFITQKTRRYLYLILQLIMQYEQEQYVEKTYTKMLIADLERPSIFFMVKHLLINIYPHLIPFLISNIELIPPAFQMIDEIHLNDNIIIPNEGADEKYKKEFKLRNEFWWEFFEITLDHFKENYSYSNENNLNKNRLIGEALSGIFISVSQKIFGQYNNIVPSADIFLNAMQERYTLAFQILKKAKTKFNIYNKGLYVKSKLSYFLLPDIIKDIEFRLIPSKIKYNHFFDLSIENLDVLIDMIGIAIVPHDSIEIEETQKQAINELISISVKCVYDYLVYFFTADKMDIVDYNFIIKTVDVEIAFDINKLDRTNWTLLIMLLSKNDLYRGLMDVFDSAIKLDKSKTRYDYPNKNQYHRIKAMLRILLYSYLNMTKEKNYYDFPVEQQKKITLNLENSIAKYAELYSKDDIPNNQIDAFYEYSTLNGLRFNDTILHLFFSALNHFSMETQKRIIANFFAKTIDLKRMLTAINIIEAEEIKKIVAEYIVKINIKDFIDSCFTVTEWEETLIEAINSEKYWHLAEPLIKNIETHYKKRKYSDEQVDFLLYQVELSLALRNKNFEKLNNTKYESRVIGIRHENNPEDIKTYFIARYWLENEKKYDKAINLLKSLLSKDEKNVRYSLLLYKARFSKSIDLNGTDLIDQKEITIAWQEWQNFEERLGNDGKKIIELHQEVILLYSLPYFIISKDNRNFDLAVTSISNELIYSSNMVKLIYDYYIERELENLAFRFLNKANVFFKNSGKTAPAIINELLVNPDNEALLKLRSAFREIITSNYRQIPFITPPILNGKKKLRIFILNELIKSMKQLQDRVKAVGIEDNYTDLVQSILAMRFPFYGWSISEQPHRGRSQKGKRAGEVDLAIKASDEDIALIEALILEGNNFSKTKEHIQKSFSYSNRSDQYYIIVYYKGNQQKFVSTWEKYKKNVKKIVFPDKKTLKNPISPFVDLNDEFENIQTFMIAKTCHDANFEMFHVMVDFSESDVSS
jgi:hypothetical protein